MNTRVSAILGNKGSEVLSLAPADTVADAVRLMNERNIGSVMVMDGDDAVGIFTERDVLVRVVARRRDPDDTKVGDVMTTRLVAINPATTVEEAMVLVTETRCRHLPVFDEDRSLVGLVSSGDLTRWMISGQKAEINDLVRYIAT
jgi:CBS domain-containing protein